MTAYRDFFYIFGEISGCSISLLLSVFSLVAHIKPEVFSRFRAQKRLRLFVFATAGIVLLAVGGRFLPAFLSNRAQLLFLSNSISLSILCFIRFSKAPASLGIRSYLVDLICVTVALASLFWGIIPPKDSPLFLNANYVFGIPLSLIVGTLHFRWFLSEVTPSFLAIVDFRLLATSYPELNAHIDQESPKVRDKEFGILDLIKGTVFVGLLGITLIIGTWIGKHPISRMAYSTLIIFLGILSFLPLSFWSGTSWMKGLRVSFGGGGLVVGVFLLLRTIWPVPVLEENEFMQVFVRGLSLSTPILLGIVGLWDHINRPVSLDRLGSGNPIKTQLLLARAIHFSLFRDDGARGLMAMVLGGVLLVYLILPYSKEVLEGIGIERIGARSTGDAIEYFRTISASWSTPQQGDNFSFGRFILGNQGLVLLYLLWSMVSLMRWLTSYDRLEKLLLPKHGFFHRIAPILSVICFCIYLLPFLFAVVFFVPVFITNLLHGAASIVIGAFAFNLLIPRIMSFTWALIGFLVAAWLTVDFKAEDSAPSNEDTLPGGG